jgi:ATP-GRASP peptide maturase of grasp-with-spasm system
MTKIFAQNNPTVISIINWLISRDISFCFINNGKDRLVGFKLLSYNSVQLSLKNDDTSYEFDVVLNDNDTDLGFIFHGNLNFDIKDSLHSYSILEHLSDEINTLKEFIDYLLHKKFIGSILGQSINKLLALKMAHRLEIAVPFSSVVSTKREFIEIVSNDDKRWITKALSNPLTLKDHIEGRITYTELVGKKDLMELQENFFPSLLQEYVEKEFELRIVFVKGKFFASAIISQNNEQTKIDFRRYDLENSNRMLPYKLPEHIEEKLTQLMSELHLDFGSFDLIYSQSGEYVFLEVNPVGQFGFVSMSCNYHIEKYISELLS